MKKESERVSFFFEKDEIFFAHQERYGKTIRFCCGSNKSTDDTTTPNDDQNAQSLYSFSNGDASFTLSSSPLLCVGTDEDSTEEEEEEEDGFFGVWMASMCTADFLVFFV